MEITEAQRCNILDYLAWHGDNNVEIVKRLPLCHECGVNVLVRLTNKAGVDYSVILLEDTDGTFTEMWSSERQDESKMIDTYNEFEFGGSEQCETESSATD